MINADLKELNFISDFDGLEISAVAAVPTDNVCGVVQLVHGMNEYKERYFDFMDYLAEQGFITVIHDNRGHGKSIASPDDLGYMYPNGGEGFVADIAQMNSIAHGVFPDLPCFMIAHSMGSLGARCFLKENDNLIDGLILLGSPSYSRFSRPVRAICSTAAVDKQKRERIETIEEASEKLFNRGFGSVPHSWICSRKEVVEEFNSNSLSNFIYTLNGFDALLYLLKETYSSKGWDVKSPQLPIRFISGKKDPVMLSEKKFFKAVENLRRKGYESISHRLFDNMRHEVLNEKNNIAVYRDIAKTLFSWIDRINQIM
ncbi:MAG: alpha/beta fold hydrolase [Ruminococcus sp.]|nr:alpha/beta fold hydrolase [Ruminococcus sp.]